MIRRVAVIGNSCALEVAGFRNQRDERTWGEWLEQDLVAAGHPALVFNQARWFELITEGRARYLADVRPLFADVLVIQYGCNECQPAALPLWLARHSASMYQSSRTLPMLYREHILIRFGWPAIRRWQQRAAPRWPRRWTRLSVRRWEEELFRMALQARFDGMLVLILDVSRFGSRYEHWIPSVSRHRQRFQEALERTVEWMNDPFVMRIDPDAVLADLGEDKTIPDGLHWSPEAHRRVGRLLADRIDAWDQATAGANDER